ncbi:MAG: UDP-N-acetylmuramoylalanine-D-glutamate ligase [Candidatus Gottesmanbacteria bacterium GW2011_GWA1_47_8]|uniref:UDP-N-acetylmuramoylalanine--D-glutamate ligase n=1 Tax=Candidatus Gottesmanbacteria bacterium GW2011_GWA1_47_8 TaxID=1618438 RepID=A0A0G1WEL1_9BACT|nr:MAG: UDP-N-acetylmuramoylalanine-D-glutamate ligase [Candidatus Gottesmanbacteria bacterium GW2011_GWA1_47_8]
MQTYKNKKVAIVGLSVEGLDSVDFFRSEDAIVTCCDRRMKEELGDTYTQLAKQDVTFHLGDEHLSNLSEFDIVVRTPGILLDTQELGRYKGILTSQTKLFFDLCRPSIIGVTGTKGKGTTSSLIAEMLRKSGKKVFLGGNVGTPLLSKVREMTDKDIVVLELSSFQLEDLTKSPHIAVVLPITQDHLANIDPLATNYHKSREDYVKAKFSIIAFQTKTDVIIANADNETSVSFAQHSAGRKYFVSRKQQTNAFVENHEVFVSWQEKIERICGLDEVILRGEHNLENIATASLAALVSGASLESVRNAAKQFKGLPHRLQFVDTVNGVAFYDDSFSTVPETTIAAIASFFETIILIAGGSEKGSDFSDLGKIIVNSSVKTLIVIGTMTDRIVKAAEDAHFSGEIVTGLRTMEEVVKIVFARARPGDVVLLSPACASFDMFPNYKERGKQFAYEVSRL